MGGFKRKGLRMNESEKYIKNSIYEGYGSPDNTPSQLGGLQKGYMADRTRIFQRERSYLSTDYVKARVQGIYKDDFYKWADTFIRMSDINETHETVLDLKKQDDYKKVLFPEVFIEYFPLGAKIEALGSTWICVNPSNLSDGTASAIVARCNASYNSYDPYGNIVTEPLTLYKSSMLNTDPKRMNNRSNLVLAEGYFNVICQLNDTTRALDENQRIILGRKAYYITGFTDFVQEFTGDYDSVHALSFTVRLGEPTETDDIENRIADGKTQSFSANIEGASQMFVGSTKPIVASFIRNGEVVENSEEFPVSWVYSSSDEEVATVDTYGNVTGVNGGTVLIKATLNENPSVTAEHQIIIMRNRLQGRIEITQTVYQSLTQYEEAELSAVYYGSNGEPTDDTVSWEASGADIGSYSMETDGNTATVTCLSGSDTALVITASFGGVTESVTFQLNGY